MTIHQAVEYLRPHWIEQTITFTCPPGLLDTGTGPLQDVEDFDAFDRTLIAYCAAYNVKPSIIRYTVMNEFDEGPTFQLLKPDKRDNYTVQELLAVMRALRYNESFGAISFKDISLQVLHGLRDQIGSDHVAWTTRNGEPLRKYLDVRQDAQSLLIQEVQALAAKAFRLRRMDFTNTLPKRRPRDAFEEGAEKDPGCEITAALLPLCRHQLTSVDWITLSGVELGDTDLELLVEALGHRECQFRAIELSRCGLNDHNMESFLNQLTHQSETLECLDISDNPARLTLQNLQSNMSRFANLRKLNLSRVLRTSGPEPLITEKAMGAWQLEELIMDGTPVSIGY